MQLNPSEISELLKQRIEGMGLNTNLRTESKPSRRSLHSTANY